MPCEWPVQLMMKQISNGPDQTVCFPRVVGWKSRPFERLMNRRIAKTTQQLIDELAGDTPSTVKGMLGWYEIKNNQRRVLSLTLANNTYHDMAAHPMTVMKSLTFDLEKEKECQLADLFKPGSNYVERISELVKLQLKERDIQTLVEFKEIRPDQDFYIADKVLVIYFQLYEITAYAFGFPMFPISVYSLQDIVQEDGALGRMGYND